MKRCDVARSMGVSLMVYNEANISDMIRTPNLHLAGRRSDRVDDVPNDPRLKSTDERFAVFSVRSIQSHGLPLCRKPENGIVVFDLLEIPSNYYQLDNGLRLQRTDDGDFIIDNVQYTLDELQAIATKQDAILLKKQKIAEEDERQRKLDAMHAATSFEALPEDVKKLIRSVKIDVESLKDPTRFEAMLNILRFTEKRDFRTFAMRNRHVIKYTAPEDDPSTSRLLHRAQQEAVVDPKAKKYFKSSELTGKGGFGKVFFAEQHQPAFNMVAIKKMKHTNAKEKTANYLELGFLIECQHPNIVKYMSSFLFNDELWIVTEFMSGGTLRDAIKVKKLDESHIAFISREILKALEYLHYKKIIHRDVKSDNIMLTTDGNVKLIDMGLCDSLSIKEHSNSMCGSAMYMSPEVIQNQPYGYPTDIWGFGITIAEMLNGSTPNNSVPKLMGMYRSACYPLETITLDLKKKPSAEMHQFFSSCIHPDQYERPTAQELLNMDFIKKAAPKKVMSDMLVEIFLANALMDTGLF
ncbi:hypothetical protein PROFUN_07616 [Planoprotostelium fungivorum]|uniref:Protein kinase domain-containing protein n=1 Tax=Planoprotostelium fungivorum TaxID=1890364 RepID=A0A2P6NK23_9EUKA|nr:hypothetical protein PROFUN_07616 [Planoprotostelium fungivorum]